MCLIVLALDSHPQYPLVIAGNRDEFLARPSNAADWWRDAPRVLGGRDLEAGGSWMGVTSNGRLAAVTNYREAIPRQPEALSRGNLVAQFLGSPANCATYLADVSSRAFAYNGYSLLVGTNLGSPGCEVWVDSNRTLQGATRLSAGIFGLSNGPPNSPWPKVVRARRGLKAALAPMLLDRAQLAHQLMDLLADPTEARASELPTTGVSEEIERKLSATFVRMPGYGTRTSTVFMVDDAGAAFFVERTYNGESEPHERKFSFQIEGD